MPNLDSLLISLGFLSGSLFLARILVSSFFNVYSTFFKPRKNLALRYGPGSWAIVTGASDGIGKAFCFDLALQGFKICLVARNKEKLQRVETELQEHLRKNKKEKVETKIILFDFSKSAEPKELEKLFS
jgi:17beta-estradiol 17-dehydrogenase / very-long-chain 3-oxoacyl-CoA reductase